MSKEGKNKVVPKLRFPEFKGSEGWLVMRLEEILLEGKLGGNYENSDANSGVPVIKMGNLERGSINVEKLQYLPNDSEYNEVDVLKRSDLLLNTRNTLELVGKVAIWKNELPKALYNSNLLRLTFHKDAIASNYFMNYCFNTQSMLGAIRSIATGTTSVAAIYTKDLLKLELSIPNPKEQQKIADCLSSLDDLITAENQKLESLKAHKKGLMQQLFPTEGETVPKLRFAEFKYSGEWEEKTLEEVGKFVGGGTPSKSNQTYWKGNIPWISSSDIDEESIHQIRISRYINDEALEDSATKLVPPNSILLVSRVGVGKLAITREAICTSQDFTNLTPNNDDLIFLAYYLKSLSKTLLAFSQGMAIKGFTKDDVSKLKLFIPTLKEQQKIANSLSSLDELIAAQTQKTEALKQHKKGLMQGLFPA